MKSRISPAMVVACVALAVALGGVGYAAVTLPKNSVGAAQLKANAVNGAKVKNKSLGPKDIQQGKLGFGKTVTVSGLEFRPRSSVTTINGAAGNGCINKTAGGDYVTAPVSLPQGARVTKVVFDYIDSDPGSITLVFSRLNGVSLGVNDLRFGVTSGSVVGLRRFTYTGSPITVVDNAKYSYALQVLLNATPAHQICGAHVTYTMP